jgi:membrane protein
MVIQFLKRLRNAEISLLSSSLAFTSMISLVPMIAISLSVLRRTGGTDKLVRKIEPLLFDFFLGNIGIDIGKQLHRSIERIQSGVVGFAGIVGFIIISLKLFSDIEVAIHRIWQAPMKRHVVQRFLVYGIFMLAGPLILASVLGLMSGAEKEFTTIKLYRDYIGGVLVFMPLYAFYKWGPSLNVKTWAAMVPAVMITIAMVIIENFYAYLFKKVFVYGKVYGSLAAIPMFLIWLQIIWMLFFLGVAISAGLQRR